MASNMYTVDMLMNINTANVNADVNADVNANEYIVTLFNMYANQVPMDMYNRLWDQQNSGNHVFGDMQNGPLPDWAIMIMTITTWKLFNAPRNDYTWELLSTAALGNEHRQKQYAMSFIKWWSEQSIKPKPFNPHRQMRAPARTQEHAGAWMLT